MATQTIDRVRELVSEESLKFIRRIPVGFSVTDLKPRARMFPFFDDVSVSPFVTPTSGPDAGVPGGRLIANQAGELSGVFNIPGMSFLTGERAFRLTENENYALDSMPGAIYGYATAMFTSNGVKQTYQETVTETNTSERIVIQQVEQIQYIRQDLPPPPPPAFDLNNQGGDGAGSDPLAQSFFTYGVDGGCFITSIDLFVQSKDEQLPLIVEVREMINGYPGPSLANPQARISLPPEFINISNDATAVTNFKFKNPFYLEEDKDYCFVVLANCQTYNIFTCTMGERSFETGKTVFEQPLLGSMFKSQNNMTWTAEQYEDIKFNIYKAQFATNAHAQVRFHAASPAVAVPTNSLSTTAGSNVIRATFTFDHNLEVGSRVGVAFDERGVYNGILAAALTGTFNVVRVLSTRIFEFLVVPNATTTGPIMSGGFVSHIYVDNEGSGYDVLNPPTITITAPPSGVTATAVPVISNGKITGINMTHVGSGYINPPSVTITGSVGTGASGTSTLDVKASVLTNRAYSIINPAIPNLKLAGTDIQASYTYTRGNYEGGNITSYTMAPPVPFNINDRNWLAQNAWLVSIVNEYGMMSENKSSVLNLSLSSTNPNISPVISTKDAYAMFSGHLINNQASEDILSDDSVGEIVEIRVIDGGAGYVSPPTVNFTNPYGDNGTGATATAVLTGGVVTGVVITNPGTGYYVPPMISFSGASVGQASAIAILNDFNSELGANSGTARSRYVTKVNTLEASSESARVFVTAYSGQHSSFDVYLRTSLKATGVVHEAQLWTLMECDVERNMSTKEGEFLDYEFYLDGLDKFDAYDLKIVFRSLNPVDVPIIKSYRAITTL